MIIRKDTEEKRTYEIPGIPEELPSVTTILDVVTIIPAQYYVNVTLDYQKERAAEIIKSGEITLEKFKDIFTGKVYQEAKEHHKKRLKEAGDIGTKTHELISEFLLAIKEGKDDIELVIPNEIEQPVNAFFEWWHENRVKPVDIELPVWSLDAGGWAGTLDNNSELSDGLWLIDFKTTKAVYWTHVYQLAAYFHAYCQCYDKAKKDFRGAGILRLDKETGYPEFHKFYYPDDIEPRIDAWLDLASFYNKKQTIHERDEAVKAEERKKAREIKKRDKEILKQIKEDPF